MDSFTDLPPVTAPPQPHAVNPPPQFSGNTAHPPYSEMIIAAITDLNDKDGSSRQAIAKYIERVYANLPPTHSSLLTHHLKRMKNDGDLIMVKHSYMLPNPRSVPFQPPTLTMDHHFTDYSVTATDNFVNFKPENSSVTPRRKPGRPPKPRHDFGFQVQTELTGQQPQPPVEIPPYQPEFDHNLGASGQDLQSNYAGGAEPIFASLGLADDGVSGALRAPENVVVAVKRGRGRPPKGGGGGDVEPGNGGRRKLMSISMVNGERAKRGRPKRIVEAVTVPLSGNFTRPRGRPKRAISMPPVNGGDAASGSVSRGRGRGRPPKNKFRGLTSQSYGVPNKVGTGTAVIVTDPHQLVAYQELKFKYEQLQSKVKEAVGVVRPYINPEFEAFGALQELETLVGTDANVETEKQM